MAEYDATESEEGVKAVKYHAKKYFNREFQIELSEDIDSILREC